MTLIISGIWGGVKSAVKSSVQYVSRAVSEGLGATESYQDIREFLDPDLLEEEYIGQYDLYDDSLEKWQGIHDIPDSYFVSGEFATRTSLDYRQSHIMKMKVSAFDLNTEQFIETWVTVESDRPRTKAGWQSGALSATADTLAGTDLAIESVLEYQYYIKE